jgi:hypothetical protein
MVSANPITTRHSPAATSGPAVFPPDEQPEYRSGGDDQQPLGLTLPLALLHQRQQKQYDPDTEQDDAGRVEAVDAALRDRMSRYPAVAEDDPDDAYRDVDEEHEPPALVCAGDLDDRATQQRADRGGDPDRGAQHAERPATLSRHEQLLDHSADLRVDDAGGSALHQPGDHQPQGGLRQSGRRTGEREQCQPGDEDIAPPTRVAELTSRNQHQSEGESISGQDPLQFRWREPEPGLYGRNRDVDDADVEQGHEHGDQTDDHGAPAVTVPVALAPRGCAVHSVTPPR